MQSAKFAPTSPRRAKLSRVVNVGRTGAPIHSMLEPAEIGGATGSCNAAQLHLIREKDGGRDWVRVKRAGEAILQVIGPIPGGATRPIRLTGPRADALSCVQDEGQRDEEEVAIYCPNAACPGRQPGSLVHFGSRGRWTFAACRTRESSSRPRRTDSRCR
jgi:DNA ligase (NAD+)